MVGWPIPTKTKRTPTHPRDFGVWFSGPALIFAPSPDYSFPNHRHALSAFRLRIWSKVPSSEAWSDKEIVECSTFLNLPGRASMKFQFHRDFERFEIEIPQIFRKILNGTLEKSLQDIGDFDSLVPWTVHSNGHPSMSNLAAAKGRGLHFFQGEEHPRNCWSSAAGLEAV